MCARVVSTDELSMGQPNTSVGQLSACLSLEKAAICGLQPAFCCTLVNQRFAPPNVNDIDYPFDFYRFSRIFHHNGRKSASEYLIRTQLPSSFSLFSFRPNPYFYAFFLLDCIFICMIKTHSPSRNCISLR